jgi:hypothetical protein
MPRSEDFLPMPCPELIKGFALVNALMNNALGFWAIDRFPQFPDRCSMRERLTQKRLKTSTTPDTFHGQGFKSDG